MRWYLSITRHFIIPTWSRFSRCPIRCIMRPDIREKIDWYAILFYIQHLLNTELILLWMMTTNWFLMYVYSLLNIGGSENSNDRPRALGMLVHPRAFQAHHQASQARPRASQVHPWVEMILILTPTWILQTRPWVRVISRLVPSAPIPCMS